MYLCECQSMADADDHAVGNAVRKISNENYVYQNRPIKETSLLIIVSVEGTCSEENVQTDLCTPTKTYTYQKRPNDCGCP